MLFVLCFLKYISDKQTWSLQRLEKVFNLSHFLLNNILTWRDLGGKPALVKLNSQFQYQSKDQALSKLDKLFYIWTSLLPTYTCLDLEGFFSSMNHVKQMVFQVVSWASGQQRETSISRCSSHLSLSPEAFDLTVQWVLCKNLEKQPETQWPTLV